MNYDKNSFLAGVSVGRTLKGWATGGGGFGVHARAVTDALTKLSMKLLGTVSIAAALTPPGIVAQAAGLVYMGDSIKNLGTVSLSAALSPPGIGAAMTGTGAAWYGVETETASAAAALSAPGLAAQVTGASMEKEED